MDLLADENVETEWIQALGDDGHDIIRVMDVDELGASAADSAVLRGGGAAERNRVRLTVDLADFSVPPTDDHSGIIIIASVTRTGSEVRRAVRRIERAVPDLSGHVAYISDWF